MGTQCIDFLRLVLNQKLMKFYDLIEPSKINGLPETRRRVDKSSKPGQAYDTHTQVQKITIRIY